MTGSENAGSMSKPCMWFSRHQASQ